VCSINNIVWIIYSYDFNFSYSLNNSLYNSCNKQVEVAISQKFISILQLGDNTMKAVVMAGGFGTRIQPLTNSRPKPMLPVINRPMMENTMLTLRDLGIKDFIILLYFKPEVIQNYFGDGSDFGMNITYVIPDDDYGTAGAVKLAQDHIGDDNFIIISGDLVTDFDFKRYLTITKRKSPSLLLHLLL
jgi:mannose-1-phosphate guanylyltransferase/phosphomannomutase